MERLGEVFPGRFSLVKFPGSLSFPANLPFHLNCNGGFMKSAFKDYRSLLVSLVEEGFLTWEDVAREFIAQGANDDSLAVIEVFASDSVSIDAFVSTEVE